MMGRQHDSRLVTVCLWLRAADRQAVSEVRADLVSRVLADLDNILYKIFMHPAMSDICHFLSLNVVAIKSQLTPRHSQIYKAGQAMTFTK